MSEVLAAIGLLVGSVLIALGALGLVRFPDVLTRMHAATKAATVGVIGTTAAAAFEAGTVAGTLILVLVVALLFLTGPLGMSLLARAAYRDPATPRSLRTRDITIRLSAAESAPIGHAGGPSRLLWLWLFGVWVAAFGSLAPNVVVGGLVVSTTVALLLRRLAPRWPGALRHPVATLRFVGFFARQLVAGTWDVIRSLRLRPDELRPAIVEVPLRATTRNEVSLLMTAISFIPGTVSLEVHDTHLYVHVLTTDDPTEVVAEIAAIEDRIIAAFGTDIHPGHGSHVSEDV